MGRGLRKKILKRLLFVVVVLTIVFGGAELLLRLFGLSINSADVTRDDTLMFHEVERGHVQWDEYITLGVHIYPLDMQNYNIPRPLETKPEGVTRVICLGDSSTIGAEVRPDQPYAQVLQRLVDRCYPDRKIEVWNFGKHGYTSYQGRTLVESVWEVARPDVITFYFGANDMSIAPIREDKDWETMPRWALKMHQDLYTHSALYRMLRNVNMQYLRRKVTLAFDENQPKNISRMRVSEKDFFANRDALRQRVEATGGRLLTVISAGLTHEKIVPAPCFLDYQAGPDDIDEIALFTPPYEAGQNPYADYVHPNAQGHRLLAEALLLKLSENWGPPACNLKQVLAEESSRP